MRQANLLSHKPAVLLFAVSGLVLPQIALADVTISTEATANVVCAGGICSPTAADAVLNVKDLETLLASGTVEVTTTGSGVQANNIDVAASLSWSTSSGLTLDAYQSIDIDAGVSVAALSGLTLTTDDGGSGGALTFGSKGNVSFANLSSALTINGTAFVLAGDLKTLAAAVAANPNGEYALASSYDASADGTYTTDPVETVLGGEFEGLGNSIKNLSVNDAADANVGFFSEVGPGGTLRDLRIVNAKMTGGNEANEGGLLAGINEGSVFACQASGNLRRDQSSRHSGGGEFGGLVGYNEQGSIANSQASVSVSNAVVAGGLVGGNGATIENSFALGNVSYRSPSGGVLGGLAGSNFGVIAVAFSAGNVVSGSKAWVGGLVGYNTETGSISNAYATGSATTGSRSSAVAGGLIGLNESSSTSSTSYSTGAVSGGNKALVGGSVGYDGGSGEWSNIYWNTTTSGTDQGTGYGNIAGITGLTSKQLKSGLPAGFDSSIWGQKKGINRGFPYLLAIQPKK